MKRALALAALLALSALLVDLVLIQPNHPGAMTWGALRLVPLELPVLLLGLMALGRRAWPLAVLSSLALTVMVALKIADQASYTAFGRGFDPVVDVNLLPAAMNLLSGTLGPWGTGLALAVALALLVALAVALYAALRLWARTGSRMPAAGRIAAGGVACVFAFLATVELRTAAYGWTGWNPPGAAFTTRLAVEHLRDARASRAALEEFLSAAAKDSWGPDDGVLSRLEGRDVVIVFVESYGRAAFDNQIYAHRHGETLARGEAALERAGLAARSGWIDSPVTGGQSWLAHGTLASGLEIGDQRRYGAMLASPRRTLYDLAAAAGYDTMAVEPAITMPWPEGPQMGFRHIYTAADLGYRGLPFDWVTMPDQFTLSAFDRLAPRGAPLMAEIALVSSHAPWTPVARMVPWAAVGDGSIFDAAATSGPSPAEVWAEPDRIRAQFGQALDYSVRTVLSWAALPRDRVPLLVVLGDHQPAGFVAQAGGAAVPVHLIAPPEVLALFDGWGWTPGLTPDAALAPLPMRDFRDRFLTATSRPDGGEM